MKFSHKYIGTPVLSFIVRRRFKAKIKDINCGLRGCSKQKIQELNLKAEGMEFASEMIIKATKAGLRIKEIPINFYKDKRGEKPHLNTLKDGIRHLKLIYQIKK